MPFKPPRVTDLKRSADVETIIALFHGSHPVGRPGVLHVSSCWRASDGVLRSLRINEHTPRSPHDFFLLNLARARADVILVTGKLLRDEPSVRFELQGVDVPLKGLRRYREQTLGKAGEPQLAVLTRGRDLDPGHPALASGRARVLTDADGRERLQSAHGERTPPLVVLPEPSLPGAIRWLHEAALETVSVEAGPSTSRRLYGRPPLVDELLLGMFEGPDVPPEVKGAELPSEAALGELLGHPKTDFPVSEASGPWRFRRYCRQ